MRHGGTDLVLVVMLVGDGAKTNADGSFASPVICDGSPREDALLNADRPPSLLLQLLIESFTSCESPLKLPSPLPW